MLLALTDGTYVAGNSPCCAYDEHCVPTLVVWAFRLLFLRPTKSFSFSDDVIEQRVVGPLKKEVINHSCCSDFDQRWS